MDTTIIMAVSRMPLIRAEVHAAAVAVQQLVWRLEAETIAVIVVYLLKNLKLL